MLVLIEKLVVNDAVLTIATGAIKGHLKILVVDRDLMKGELHIGIHAQAARATGAVLQGYVPQLHRLAAGDEHRLRCGYAAAAALVYTVAQPVAAAIICKIPAARLPGDRPVFAGIVVPQVYVVPGAIHGHAVGAKARHTPMLRAFVEHIPAGGVVQDCAEVFHTQIVRP